jgi:RimJ/RimL family protein N-acetyltransferase
VLERGERAGGSPDSWKDRRAAFVLPCMQNKHQTSDVSYRMEAPPLEVPDGTSIKLRPVGRDDRDGVADLFARLSPESRHRRYFLPKRELTPRELASLTDIDHVSHEAFAAVAQRGGSIVGIGRYVEHADRAGVADVAFEVADEFQHRGIGTALGERIVERARENGFVRLTATTLWENRPARLLMRRLGFLARSSRGTEIELELALDPQAEQPS